MKGEEVSQAIISGCIPEGSPSEWGGNCGRLFGVAAGLDRLSVRSLHGARTMWPDQPETRELLDRARRGEAAAVDRLLDRHRAALRRLVQLRLDAGIRRRVDASDVVQEALLDASRRLDQYLQNPVLPFHLWLRHIALDRVADAHRRHRQAQRRSVDRERPLRLVRLPEGSSVDLAAALADPELTPASAALQHELERRFEAALGQMAEGDRDIILMRHFEHLSNQDVAGLLGLSEAAAAMRYLRALKRLRGLLLPESQDAE